MSSVEIECAHTDTRWQGQTTEHVLSASTDDHGRWTSGGELLGVHRWTAGEDGRPVFDQPGRGRIAVLECPTCQRRVRRRGLALGRDLDALVAAGMDRVDLRVLEWRASSVR
ncbi:hypothetical protein [Actinomycetospora soli]|uniref:hypothetical protein n=1 Tax=Actinomycetospora soli TaxID=2893887 RepID=UPI001E339E5D|nr:hypothetical protein [Actinomycetospora soli]MCD2191680.1 hypothetical protein [Actinomycetospora soli]